MSTDAASLFNTVPGTRLKYTYDHYLREVQYVLQNIPYFFYLSAERECCCVLAAFDVFGHVLLIIMARVNVRMMGLYISLCSTSHKLRTTANLTWNLSLRLEEPQQLSPFLLFILYYDQQMQN